MSIKKSFSTLQDHDNNFFISTYQISPKSAGVFNGGIISPVGEIRKGVSEMVLEEKGSPEFNGKLFIIKTMRLQ